MGVDTHVSDFVRSRLPKLTKANVMLSAALLGLVGVAVLAGVHAATAGSGKLSSESGEAVQSTSSLGSVRVASSPQIASLSGAGRTSSKARPSSTTSASPSASSSRGAGSSPAIGSSPGATTSSAATSSTPVGGASYAGSLIMDASGSQLVSWNATSSFCPTTSWQVADGQVSTGSGGAAALETTGKLGSCVALISPGAYSSAVVEASVDFPALPSNARTIANWTSLWMTDQAAWPTNGELDAAEVEPDTGVAAVTYHWGTAQSPSRISTDGGAAGDVLPIDGPNLTPGWHTVDIVYTKGFFAVYYDGVLYSSLTSSVITGAALNILISAAVTPDTSAVQQELGGPPINSDTSPATIMVNYVKVWSYR